MWLAHSGPALLHVKVKPMQLVTPPSAFVSPEAVVGMAVYTARPMLHGKGHDVWEMVVDNISTHRIGARILLKPVGEQELLRVIGKALMSR